MLSRAYLGIALLLAASCIVLCAGAVAPVSAQEEVDSLPGLFGTEKCRTDPPRPAASIFYRLVAGDFTQTHKMVLLR